MRFDARMGAGVALFTAGAALVALACSSSSDDSSPAPAVETDGVLEGPKDVHCNKKTVTVDPAACHATSDAGADGGGVEIVDAGTGSPYGATMFNAEGDDDACKYHVKWSASGVEKGSNATFVVTLTNKSDGSPLAGAPVDAEVFLTDTHTAPPRGATTREGPAGTYTIGPIRFDAPGRWTIRFHVHAECNEGETSPHGHAAFFLRVP